MKENPLQQENDRFNAQNSTRFCINLDWLQMHVSGETIFKEDETPLVKITRTGQSKVFKSIYTITLKKHKRVIATYATEALEQIMKTGHGVLKIDNYYLYHYSARMQDFVTWFLRKLRLEFIGITRIDIAYDFQSFCDKREPEDFIKSFLKNDILKKLKSKFRVAGNHNFINEFNWITFGSKTSTVNYKLYNKSLEMKEATFKQHIFKDWQASSFDLDKDVWRIEFTVNSNTTTLMNEDLKFNFHSVETVRIDVICGLFHKLFEHYFTFVFYDKRQKRKDRMKEVKLLIFPDQFKRIHMFDTNPFQKDTDRSTKIFVNKMNSLQEELRGKDDDFIQDARVMINKLISIYNLENWATKKGIEFTPTNYVNDLNEANK
jgi:hypothetical protein